MDFFESGVLGRLFDADDSEMKHSDSCSCPQPVGKFPAETPVAMAISHLAIDEAFHLYSKQGMALPSIFGG